MKKVIYLIMISFLILSLSNNLRAKESRAFLTGGFHRSGYIGSGDGGNEFDFGNGFNLEIGAFTNKKAGIVLYGFSMTNLKNHVNESTADVKFLTPYYTEVRFTMDETMRYHLFWIFGYDYNRVKFENTKGYDNQHLWSFGLGAHLQFTRTMHIQFKVKPYLISGNSLDQSLGLTMQANIGFNGEK